MDADTADRRRDAAQRALGTTRVADMSPAAASRGGAFSCRGDQRGATRRRISASRPTEAATVRSSTVSNPVAPP